MSGDFPFVIGRIPLTDEWSIDLPVRFKRRIEEGSLVFWRPGLTIWLDAWGNDTGHSADERIEEFADGRSARAYDVTVERESPEIVRYSYRLDGESDDNRAPAYYAFTFRPDGHLRLAIYFDDEADVELARAIHHSASDAPPEIGNMRVLSGHCFATNAVFDTGRVGYAYRESPDHEHDSGWRFFTGTESQEYVDDPENTTIRSVSEVAELDRSVIPFLNAEPGTAWGRTDDGWEPE